MRSPTRPAPAPPSRPGRSARRTGRWGAHRRPPAGLHSSSPGCPKAAAPQTSSLPPAGRAWESSTWNQILGSRAVFRNVGGPSYLCLTAATCWGSPPAVLAWSVPTPFCHRAVTPPASLPRPPAVRKQPSLCEGGGRAGVGQGALRPFDVPAGCGDAGRIKRPQNGRLTLAHGGAAPARAPSGLCLSAEETLLPPAPPQP